MHYILNQEEDSLMLRFFNAQLSNPVEGDWTEQVEKDLQDLNMNLSMNEIKSLSEECFRTKVKNAILKAAFEWLTSEKLKRSNVMNISYEKLQMQEYLLSTEMETREKKLLFQLRTRMVDLKVNFKNGHADLSCPLCSRSEDNQMHVLECSIILRNTSFFSDQSSAYSDIFSDEVKKQAVVAKTFSALWKIRSKEIKKGSHPSVVTPSDLTMLWSASGLVSV